MVNVYFEMKYMMFMLLFVDCVLLSDVDVNVNVNDDGFMSYVLCVIKLWNVVMYYLVCKFGLSMGVEVILGGDENVLFV